MVELVERATAAKPRPTIKLSENSQAVLERRYLRKGTNGKAKETIEEMFFRVASHIASAELESGGNMEQTTETFYNLLTEFRFMPNSPTFTGAGTPLGQLAACFVLPIGDDMGKDETGIFQTLRDAALIQQTGGGNGFAFSKLRPKGALVKSSAGQATGPVGFLRVYDQAFGEIAQGGTRRGANMAVLRINHPDIREFITCKTDENHITNFNISVGVTDDFMRAVEDDDDFDLINPQDGEVWETVRAREIFDLVVKQAHHNGEPGVLFLGDYDLTPFGPWYGDVYSSIEETLTSLERLRRIPARVWITGHEQGVFEEDPGELWDNYGNVIWEREQRLLELLSQPRSRQDIVEAWIVYGKPREPRYFFEFGEWGIMEKHLDRLIRLGLVEHVKGRYVRREES